MEENNIEAESKVNALLSGALSLEDALGIVDEIAEMEGLGAIRRVRVPFARTIHQKSVKKASTNIVARNASKGQQILIARKDVLGADLKKSIDTGELQFVEGDLYHRTLVAGGNGSYSELIQTSNERQYGISSFEKMQIPTQHAIAVERIRFGWGIRANAVNAADVNYTSTFFDASGNPIPAVLQNSDLVISLNDTVICELPITRFITYGQPQLTSNGNAQGYTDAVRLNQIKIIKDKTNVNMKLRTPIGLTLPANLYVEVRLLGDMVRPKSIGY